MKNAIATLYYGSHGVELSKITQERHKRYSEKCGAVFVPLCLESLPHHRMYIFRELLDKYERVLWVDGDALIHTSTPNLFDIVPADCFAAVDECTTGNDAEVDCRQQHIIATCVEEGIAIPETHGRKFNLGVSLVPSVYKECWSPRLTTSSHDWREESLINARLMLSQAKIVTLPECFNRFAYYGFKPRRFADATYILHYAGPSTLGQRIKDMQKQSDEWGDL